MVGLDGLLLPRRVDPLEPSTAGLPGPFSSPDDYIAKRGDGPDDGCRANTGKPSVGKKSLVGRDDIEELMLFRAKTGDSCTPTEHCFMAIRTESQWWVGERLCVGPIDGEREMTTADTTLRWVSLKAQAAALVEYTVTVKKKGSAKTLEELRWMRLCGVGKSGKPTCTRPALLSCVEDDGSKTTSKLDIDKGRIVITSSAKPGEACDGHESFVTGTFDVVFP